MADGAIDVTSMVVGKVSELADGEGSFTLRGHALEACANRELPAGVSWRHPPEVRDSEGALSIELYVFSAGLMASASWKGPQRRSLAPPRPVLSPIFALL